MKYSKSRNQSGVGRPARWVSRALLVAVILALITFATLGVSGVWTGFPFGVSSEDTELLEMWVGGDYESVTVRSEELLSGAPFHAQALTFGGFGHFYVGVDALTREEQVSHLDRAITYLRKTLHIDRAPLAPERDYVLAKAYYHKGETYMDQVVHYMERSLDAGYEAADSRSYLGLAYASLGDYHKSIDWFQQSITTAVAREDTEDANAGRIKLAESYVAVEDFDMAARVLRTAIAELDDDYLELMARNRLVSVLVGSGDYDAAEVLAAGTVREYPESADAHYYLGVVYSRTDRIVEARDQWRTARRIDPAHVLALESLANREY